MKKTHKNAVLMLVPFMIVALFLASLYVWGVMSVMVMAWAAVVVVSFNVLRTIGGMLVDHYGDK